MLDKLRYPSIPPRDYKICKEEHIAAGRAENFLAYERVGANRFVRNVLYLKQHGICPVCKDFLVSPESAGNQVHHITYERFCAGVSESTPLIKSFCPRKNGHVYKMTANCELCFFDHPDRSEFCLETLVMVHTDCHARLHDKLPNE